MSKKPIKLMIDDYVRALDSISRVWGIIIVTIIVMICVLIKIFSFTLPNWLVFWLPDLAGLVLIGATTALFTRFLGSMGMFRDAISDLFGDDAWLDRRKDLDQLWMKITRRIFLAGLPEDSSDSTKLLAEINAATARFLRNKQGDHYMKDTKRRIKVEWEDVNKKIVKITDRMDCSVYPIKDDNTCNFDFNFRASSGLSLDQYKVQMSKLEVDDVCMIEKLIEIDEGGRRLKKRLLLSGKRSYKLKRTMSYHQCIELDPLFVFSSQKIVWGLNVLIQAGDGVKVIHEEIGLESDLKVNHIDNTTGEIELNTNSVLLPDQGFAFVMTSK